MCSNTCWRRGEAFLPATGWPMTNLNMFGIKLQPESAKRG